MNLAPACIPTNLTRTMDLAVERLYVAVCVLRNGRSSTMHVTVCTPRPRYSSSVGSLHAQCYGSISNLNCLRFEKAYREVGPDLDNSENPIEAGLGFVVKLDKEGGFLGRNALAAVGMGYVEHDAPLTTDVVEGAKWEIEICGARYAAKASLSPMYDPKLEKIKC